MKIAERLIEKGRQDGIQAGIKAGIQTGILAGIQTGESKVLLRLLEHKFGIISLVHQKRIQEADSEQLLYWAERVLKAETLEGVFEEN